MENIALLPQTCLSVRQISAVILGKRVHINAIISKTTILNNKNRQIDHHLTPVSIDAIIMIGQITPKRLEQLKL